MKKFALLFLLVLLPALGLSQPSIQKVRNLYEKAADNEEACEKLIKLLNEHKSSPLLLGYKGVVVMMMANHVFNPFKKLSYFKKGKAMLNKAIKKAAMSAELRFLRLTAQLQAPDFLGYNDYIALDKRKLAYLLSKTNNTQLKNYIAPKINHLNIFNGKLKIK